MKDLILNEFPHCLAKCCFEEIDLDYFEVFDDEITKRCQIYVGNKGLLEYPFFSVKNPAMKKLNFLAIDGCVLVDNHTERCDFATFDDKQIFFVELKRALCSEILRSEKKEKALCQLKSTLALFIGKFGLHKYRIMACSCVGYDSPIPAAPASDLNNLVEFINDFNAELLEGNGIEFC